MTPAQTLLAVLAEEGVDRVFGNPGTTELPILEALAAAPGIEYVLGLHEGPVVAMADGYARATGRPAVASLHVAAGLANGVVGLLNARRSRVPLVVLAGQQDRRHLAQDPMLAGDLVGIAAPAVKAAIQVEHAHDLGIQLRRAFALAVRPPAGPVFLSLPMDLFDDATAPLPARSTLVPPGPAPGLEAAAARLAAAERPVIVAGDGVGREDAVAALATAAARTGAAVYHQPLNDGVAFPTGHRLYAGMLPSVHTGIREMLAPHDVLLIVGCQAFTPHHYSPGSPIPDGLAVLQLDSDPAEPGRNFPVDLGLVGGIKDSLAALAALLPDAPTPAGAGIAARFAAEHDHVYTTGDGPV
ncbi:thiamine pyrophosphate-binding protein, partial [Actinocorallia aurantiaca]|uniref:thiamine pyrophosphate-binding protein n=1 Tax=Actinocorallia aurantiaca TaxID=46204 RepID=UPI0031D28722